MGLFRRTVPMTLAIAFGIFALIGLLFVPELAELLTGWAALLAAIALLIGVVNLLGVHLRRLSRGNVYSSVLVIAAFTVLALGFTDDAGVTTGGVDLVFDNVLLPLEAAVASLLAFFLLFAGFRLMSRRPSWWSFLFLGVVVLMLLGRASLPDDAGELFADLSSRITQVLVNAGMRGLLIGIAFGTIAVGLRLLIGAERPYER